MKYLSWNEETITDFSEKAVSEMYNRGYLFTRIGKGVMQQTRSLRVDLAKFELTSENRRILKKNTDLKVDIIELPWKEYDWSVGKMAKDFYDTKFGEKILSAQKTKELLTDNMKSNFSVLLAYSSRRDIGIKPPYRGYAISYSNKTLLHYCYPFYDLDQKSGDMGLGMMIIAIQYAKTAGMKYVYLGSLQRPGDIYKLQFQGLEWFDGKTWQSNIETAKTILSSDKSDS